VRHAAPKPKLLDWLRLIMARWLRESKSFGRGRGYARSDARPGYLAFC